MALQLLGAGQTPAALAGARTVFEKKTPTWQAARDGWSTAAGKYLYGWYYDTQAMFHATHGKGPEWDQWNRLFQTALIRNQHADGYWTHEEKHKMGGDSLHGKVLSTTLCCLQLEVYYRHLASFGKGFRAQTTKHASLLDDGPKLQIQ